MYNIPPMNLGNLVAKLQGKIDIKTTEQKIMGEITPYLAQNRFSDVINSPEEANSKRFVIEVEGKKYSVKVSPLYVEQLDGTFKFESIGDISWTELKDGTPVEEPKDDYENNISYLQSLANPCSLSSEDLNKFLDKIENKERI